MGFRTIVITKQCRCTYKNDFLVIKDENVKTIHLSEIDTIIFETTAVSITGYLLCEAAKFKINIIFCDDLHSPYAQLTPFFLNYQASKRVIAQTEWLPQQKAITWTSIVCEKIKNQSEILKKYGLKEYKLLQAYVQDVEFNDVTNREGHSAKVYFNALFGKEFSRKQNNDINAALNYGYSILLSTFNREIIANGYITQLGIFHRNENNHFNLSCDIMEPFRPIIDDIVMSLMPNLVFDDSVKHIMANVLNFTFIYKGSSYFLSTIINLYVKDVVKFISCATDENIKGLEFAQIL